MIDLDEPDCLCESYPCEHETLNRYREAARYILEQRVKASRACN